MKNTVAVMWPTGRVMRAGSWVALFESLRAEQWRSYSPRAFRTEMARRAFVWNDAIINLPSLGLRRNMTEDAAWDLFCQLEKAKMLRIVAPDTSDGSGWEPSWR